MALAVSGSAACSVDLESRGAVLREERTFTVEGGNLDLTVGTFDGSIAVQAWDRSEVRLEIVRRANNTGRAEALAVDVSSDGGRITIDAPAPPPGGPQVVVGPWMSDSVSFTLTVPRELALRARSGDGRIVVDGLAGTIDLETDDGSVAGDRLEGVVTVRTSDGSIQLRQLDGRVDARTSDGSVRLDGRFDRLNVDTSDGSVQVSALEGSVLEEDWSISTSDGSVRLQLPRSLDAELDARTGDGRIRAGDFGVGQNDRVDRDDDWRRLEARLGEGGRRLVVRTGDGSITLSAQ